MLSSEKELNTLSFVEKPVPGLDVLPRVLLPLAGPEEFELEVSRFLCLLHRQLCGLSQWSTGRRLAPSRTPIPTKHQNPRKGSHFANNSS